MIIPDLYYYLTLAFVLGIIHGITPDEHTWPITFSYSIGAFNKKGGAKAGLFFSLGFTAQRALLGLLSFTALASFFTGIYTDSIVFIAVGLVMSISGFYILRKNVYIDFHFFAELVDSIVHLFTGRHTHKHESSHQQFKEEGLDEHNIFAERSFLEPRKVPLPLATLHGAIAGFGFGAIDLLIYTSIVPKMPSIWYAWIPGFLFGIGTLIMQVILGYAIGSWLQRRKYSEKQITFISRKTSGRTLGYGGLVFALVGVLIFIVPPLGSFELATGISIPNLNNFDIGMGIVAVVLLITAASYLLAIKEIKQLKL
ncbi:MAG: hypothetical protein KGH71_01725 [Candidatus Micrarchaeota archaeon]|nr:hypothetical protein [Candidatus Micrarchaeota archaeon]